MTLLWSVTTPLCDSCFRALYKSCFICWFQFLILARRSNRQFHLLILPSYNVQGVPQENCHKSLKQNISGQRKYIYLVRTYFGFICFSTTLHFYILPLVFVTYLGILDFPWVSLHCFGVWIKGLILWVTTYVSIYFHSALKCCSSFNCFSEFDFEMMLMMSYLVCLLSC